MAPLSIFKIILSNFRQQTHFIAENLLSLQRIYDQIATNP